MAFRQLGVPAAVSVLLTCALAVLLSSCAPTGQARPGPVPDAPDMTAAPVTVDLTPSPDAERLIGWVAGAYTNTIQAAADPDQYVKVSVNVVPVWTDRDDGAWFYAEHAVEIDPDRPYQQRVHRLTPGVDGTVRMDSYDLPGDPLEYAGAWRAAQPLAGLSPEMLLAREDCAIVLRPEGDDMFVGSTEGTGCSSTRENAVYSTTELMIRADMFVLWERGFDERGSQVWGPRHGGYLFNRRDPAEAVVVTAGPPVTAPIEPLPPGPFERAAAYSADCGGRAMVVVRDDGLVFEQYDHGHTADREMALVSGTASFWGVLAAAAVQDGLLELDEPVCDTITEWIFDDQKVRITIRQLLNGTSGLPAGQRARGETPLPDRFLYSLSLVCEHPPGEAFTYGPSHLDVFGEVLFRKLDAEGGDPVGYLTERVLAPIGAGISRWQADEGGNPYMFFGAYMTARDWARFGQLVCNGGRWEGRQIIASERLAECLQGSDANPWYGLSFWLAEGGEAGGAGMPEDLIRATGAGHQRLFIIPSRRLVIVRLGSSRGFNDVEFLRIALADE